MASIRRERPNEKWRVDALCKGVNLSLFFPDDSPNFEVKDEPGNPGSFCLNCPVQKQCLDYAVALEIRDGIFGGLNEAQRNKLINQAARTRRKEAKMRREQSS